MAIPLGTLTSQRENFERMMKGFAPVSWWKLNEPSGTSFADSGSAGFAATLNTVGTAGIIAGATGAPVHSRTAAGNKAVQLNNSAVTAGPVPAACAAGASSYQIFGTSGTATIGCFLRVNTVGTQGFYNFPSKISGTVGFRNTMTISSRAIGFLWKDSAAVQAFPSVVTLPNDGAWHLVCGTYDRSIAGTNGTGQARSFLDGVGATVLNFPVGFLTCNQATNAIAPIVGSNTPNGIFEASDVFILGSVLTTTQMRALYQAGVR